MKRILTLVLAVAVLSAVWSRGSRDQSDNALAVTTPDLGKIEDGRYSGSFQHGLISATVYLVVQDHRITNFIITKHRCGKGRAAEAVAIRVIEHQSLEVDAVSGATASSKVLLKAAERALNNKPAKLE